MAECRFSKLELGPGFPMSFVYMVACTACERKSSLKIEYMVYTFAETLLCWKTNLVCAYKQYDRGKEGQATLLVPNTCFRCVQ